MIYELEREYYKGPMDKLLELIEEKKLEITSIALAEVTADFLKHIEKLGNDEKMREYIADFLVVASKLILIKSKTLLPSIPLTEEEEADIQNFESRLRLYRELKRAEPNIKERWSERPQMMHREFLMSTGSLFFPPRKISIDNLQGAMTKIFGELQKIMRPVVLIKAEMLNLKEKIHEIFSRLTASPIAFKKLQEGKTKSEVVVLFLAVLHLIKDQLVNVSQDSHFSDIVVARAEKNE